MIIDYKSVTEESQKRILKKILQWQRQVDIKPAPLPDKKSPLQLSQCRLFLFDIYGTLLSSPTGEVGSLGLKESVYSLESQKKILSYFDALTFADLRELFVREVEREHEKLKRRTIQYPEVDVIELWNSILLYLREKNLFYKPVTPSLVAEIAFFYEWATNPVVLQSGVKKLLKSLSQRGALCGIISNAQFYTLLELEALLGCSLKEAGFIESLSVWSFKEREAKPSVKLFQKVVERAKSEYNIMPEEILYLGNDKRNDIWPASVVGCKTLLYGGDSGALRLRSDTPECQGVEPDLCTTSWESFALQLEESDVKKAEKSQ